MEIRLTPEQEAAILQIARHEGKAAEQLMTEVALGLISKHIEQTADRV